MGASLGQCHGRDTDAFNPVLICSGRGAAGIAGRSRRRHIHYRSIQSIWLRSTAWIMLATATIAFSLVFDFSDVVLWLLGDRSI